MVREYQRMQDCTQELVQALFPDIDSSSSSKTLSEKLFQCKVIDLACLQRIQRADCDAETNAILAEHLYQAGTEKMLQDFAHILKESVLGERIKAALAEALLSTPVSSDERPHGSCKLVVDGSSDQELQQTGTGSLTLIIILTIESNGGHPVHIREMTSSHVQSGAS